MAASDMTRSAVRLLRRALPRPLRGVALATLLTASMMGPAQAHAPLPGLRDEAPDPHGDTVPTPVPPRFAQAAPAETSPAEIVPNDAPGAGPDDALGAMPTNDAPTERRSIGEVASDGMGEAGVGGAEADPTDVALIVEATLEWLAFHALGDALLHAGEIEAPGDPLDAADAFASAQVSARHPEAEAARRLVAVAEAASLAADDAPAMFQRADLSPARAFRVLCVANGADNAAARAALPFAALPPAAAGGTPTEAFEACAVDRDLATEAWDVALSEMFLFPGDPPSDVAVVLEPASAGDEAARRFLESTGLLQQLGTETAELYALFDPLTLRGASCEGAQTGYDEATRTLTVCYGLANELAALAGGALPRE